MGLCYFCGKETDTVYRCPYCNLLFCADHRLPEQHNCLKLPERDWDSYRAESIRMGRIVVTRPVPWRNPKRGTSPGRDTDTYFTRDEKANRKTQETSPIKDSDEAYFIRKNIQEKNKSEGALVYSILFLLLAATTLIVLNEFGYIDLYEWYAQIEEWYHSLNKLV